MFDNFLLFMTGQQRERSNKIMLNYMPDAVCVKQNTSKKLRSYKRLQITF